MRALASSVFRSRRAERSFPGGCVALDYFGDADLLSLSEDHPIQVLSVRRDLGRPRRIEELTRAAMNLDWRALLYSGGLENRPQELRRLERRGIVLGNGAAVLRGVRDPSLLFPFLRRAGIPHPSTLTGRLVRPPPGRSRWLWKPVRSGGGIGVRWAREGESRPRGFYLQTYLKGPAGSATFVADGRRSVLLGVSRQLVGTRKLGGDGFRYSGNIVGPPHRLLSRRALERLADAASSISGRFRLRGLGGLDFILVDGVPHILEVNPRYTASMELLEEVSTASLIDIHLDAIAGRLPPGPLAARGFLGKGILYATRDLGWSSSCAGFLRDVRDRPLEGETIEVGHPICTLVVPGGSPEGCRHRLLAAGAKLHEALRRGFPGAAPGRRVRARSRSATRPTGQASMLR